MDQCFPFDYELHIKLLILHFCAMECRMHETELFSYPVTSRIPNIKRENKFEICQTNRGIRTKRLDCLLFVWTNIQE